MAENQTHKVVGRVNEAEPRFSSPRLHETSSTVLIIGGGVVGLLTAIKLGQAGIDVQVIEVLSEPSNAPRACGYYGAVQFFLDELGMYTLMREEGFLTRGLCWRDRPADDGKGGKRHGNIIASQPLCAPDEINFPVGAGLLNLTQGQLNRLCLREALKLSPIQVQFDTEFVSILENTKDGIKILAQDANTGREQYFRVRYAIAADGAHSKVRKALNIPFAGHTWPERLLATNVAMPNVEELLWHTHFTMAEENWSITTPLQNPVVGERTLWRYAIALSPEETLSDEELLSDQNILKLYEKNMPGPRPLQVDIQARVLYKIHQRLASTLRKGNFLLAGDAAHVCNPLGALGLNTGILDVDALAEALIMVIKEGRSEKVLNIYSDERRKVFQLFVDPTSTYNKLRIHTNKPETAVQDDWYFRALAQATPEELMELGKPYFETWRTDMRKAAEGV